MSASSLATAINLVEQGLSIIPIRDDGSKAPSVRWQQYQQRRPEASELREWFARGEGMALICGKISGNVEVIDFDDPAALKPWGDTITAAAGPQFLKQFPVSRTPSGGTHIFYRCDTIAGNHKLAQKPNSSGRPETMIETRGEGGYVLIPPTPASYHPLNKPYRMLRGDLACIPRITPEERDLLLSVAKGLNRMISPPNSSNYETTGGPSLFANRPGDRFNVEHTWFDILEPHGWKALREQEGTIFWQRPGKSGRGISATTSLHHGDCLYVFSSNADPFDLGKSYTKFAAFALLEFGGSYHEAADALTDEYRIGG